jgi:hypothetical protein
VLAGSRCTGKEVVRRNAPGFACAINGGSFVRLTFLSLTLAVAVACSPLMAQTAPSANQLPLPQTTVNTRSNATVRYQNRKKLGPPKPFSVIGLSGGIGTSGINMQVATNINRYLNVRGIGNVFNYSLNNINTNGFTASGKLNFSTAGASLDVYPFPSHGFRVSPGVLFLNNNSASATMVASVGTSFTLNDVNYYTSAANPVTGAASIALNTRKQAFTITTGWGNLIPRYGGGHWSFPVELGVALVGAPSVNLALISGSVCTNPQGTANCTPVQNDASLQSNLALQVAKYNNDVKDFQYYPILSFGVGYNFHIRH